MASTFFMAMPQQDVYPLERFFRAAFRCGGFEFETVQFLRWRVIDDRVFPRPIDTLERLLEDFRDGRYHLGVEGVRISLLDGESVELESIDLELIYEDGAWKEPTVHTGEESFHGNPGDTSEVLSRHLDERYQRIIERLTGVLELISVLSDVAEHLR